MLSKSPPNLESRMMLCAPVVAGLLPARAETLLHREHDEKSSSNFLYENSRLSEIPKAENKRLCMAVTKLLDVAVACMIGDMNEAALRAAEVCFHRAVAGRSHVPPRNPADYCAQMDADVIDWYLDNAQLMTRARDEAVNEIAGMRQRM